MEDEKEIRGVEAREERRKDGGKAVGMTERGGEGGGERTLSAFTHTTVDEITLLCLAASAVTAICPSWGFATVINLCACMSKMCERAVCSSPGVECLCLDILSFR